MKVKDVCCCFCGQATFVKGDLSWMPHGKIRVYFLKIVLIIHFCVFILQNKVCRIFGVI